jgi:hypothetical protein
VWLGHGKSSASVKASDFAAAEALLSNLQTRAEGFGLNLAPIERNGALSCPFSFRGISLYVIRQTVGFR